MPSLTDFAAVGRVLSIADDHVVFNPAGTNYELKLVTDVRYAGPANQRVECLIRAVARKVYTVPSGGNFIAPIFGPPRTIQGRVLYADDRNVVVKAGAPVLVELPLTEDGIDLAVGGLHLGAIANVTALPGARFEMAPVTSEK
jgi:hypothetical protein